MSKLFSFIIPRTFLRIHKVEFKMPVAMSVFSSPPLQLYRFVLTNCARTFILCNKNNKTTVLSGNASNSACDKSKDNIISQLNFKCDEDASPFYKLPMKSLLHIHKITKKDLECGNCDNRLYYLAERLKCSPSHLSKSVARRTFIYSLPFDLLEKSLNTLLEMGVSEDRILRDLWVLKYHHKTIMERLLRVQNTGVDNLYPWMVRCSEDVLERSISISQETKSILGDIKSTKNYLAKRLNTTPEAIEELYNTIPALKRIRAPKVKKFLDFLIEEGFKVEDIAKRPRVISASQKTVTVRLDRLRKLGLKDINLNVLCRSRKDFDKFCESIRSLPDTKTL